jgi:hypothetical protein
MIDVIAGRFGTWFYQDQVLVPYIPVRSFKIRHQRHVCTFSIGIFDHYLVVSFIIIIIIMSNKNSKSLPSKRSRETTFESAKPLSNGERIYARWPENNSWYWGYIFGVTQSKNGGYKYKVSDGVMFAEMHDVGIS